MPQAGRSEALVEPADTLYHANVRTCRSPLEGGGVGPERGGRTSSRTIPRPVPTSPRFAAAASFAAASPWIISRVLMMSNGNVAVSAMQAEAAESTYVVPKLRPLLSGPPPMSARQQGLCPGLPAGASATKARCRVTSSAE